MQSTGGNGGGKPNGWDVVITEWAFDSYLDLKHRNVFTPQEYKTQLRPDVKLLQLGIPSSHPKFQNKKFWGPAKEGSVVVRNGYKMKWHQIGSGQVQLRLAITTGLKSAFLCECYEKHDDKTERRKIAKFKTHINLIEQGRFTHRGKL